VSAHQKEKMTSKRSFINKMTFLRLSLLLQLVFLLLICILTGEQHGGIVTAISSSDEYECACKLEKRPDLTKKAETARWMVHSLDWGVISSISSRLGGSGEGGVESSIPVPFGNVYSFVDGSCNTSTGIPYIYGTYMDQTFKDTINNNMVSLTLSESSLSSVCSQERHGFVDSCMIGTKYGGDPENPVCARLTLTGKLIPLMEKNRTGDDNNDNDDYAEYEFAKNALFDRHPSMVDWPVGHRWVIAKIDIQDIWLIDYFGGATILDPIDYFSVSGSGSGSGSATKSVEINT
jgi:hypothetical protein